ncbi:unnamed protein product [Mycena citricolor]|uniref:Uncharacterized protein n=1 Tax=Mycena citricolor TaxID=2018698 RepID=A0AAD2K8B0_9AGAR|nr:unnamed protein product [Mycena citricolor]
MLQVTWPLPGSSSTPDFSHAFEMVFFFINERFLALRYSAKTCDAVILAPLLSEVLIHFLLG